MDSSAGLLKTGPGQSIDESLLPSAVASGSPVLREALGLVELGEVPSAEVLGAWSAR